MMPDLKQQLLDTYAFARTAVPAYAGLPEARSPQDLARIPMTTRSMLRDAHSLLSCPEEEVRYVVSQFSSANPEELFLVPRRLDEPWGLLEAEIKEVQPFVAILAVPLFWQVAPIFYQTFRRHRVPVSVLQPRNLPLAVQLIRETRADLVVSTPEVARDLADLLHKEGMLGQIRAWHLIVPFGTKVEPPAISAPYMIEYHLFPGIPVARGLPDQSWVPLPDVHIEIGQGGTALISSLKRHALPLVKFDSGVQATQRGDSFTYA